MIQVVVAAILDDRQRILIAQRPLNKPFGGFFEFPGGKIEPDESADQALIREIDEELQIKVMHYQFLGLVKHEYPSNPILLHVFQVNQYEGNPRCHENQLALHWVESEALKNYTFPEASYAVIELLSKTMV